MKKKRTISDEALDEMLNNYFKRTPEKTFEFSEQTRKKEQKVKPAVKYAAVGVCAVCALAAVIFSQQMSDAFFNKTEVESEALASSEIQANGRGFTITAYADEAGTKTNTDTNADSYDVAARLGTIGGAKVSVTEWPYDSSGCALSPSQYDEDLGLIGYDGEVTYEKTWVGLALDSVEFVIKGDSVVSYRISSENGYLVGSNGCRENQMEKTMEDKDAKGRSRVSWRPTGDKFYDEFSVEKLIDGGYEEYLEMGLEGEKIVAAAVEEGVKTAEDYTRLFGDTVTVTALYDDGTYDTKTMKITLDETGAYCIDCE